MSLDFAIIPITSTFLSPAEDIKQKLQNKITLQMNIVIDTNYDTPFNTRINKWKKQEYDIITIDKDYDESHSIVVRFSDKGSRAQSMEIDEFIDLVASYEDEEEKQQDPESADDKQDGGCFIM